MTDDKFIKWESDLAQEHVSRGDPKPRVIKTLLKKWSLLRRLYARRLREERRKLNGKNDNS